MGPPGVALSLHLLRTGMCIWQVFRVQDHHGHAPQWHNPEKEGHIPEIIIGSEHLENQHRIPWHPQKKKVQSFAMVVETSNCGNYGSSHSIGSRANQTTGSSTPSPTWREKGAIASASWWGSLGRDSAVWNPWSQIISNHPKSSQIVPNHPKSPQIIPNHPKSSHIIPDHPKSSHPAYKKCFWKIPFPIFHTHLHTMTLPVTWSSKVPEIDVSSPKAFLHHLTVRSWSHPLLRLRRWCRSCRLWNVPKIPGSNKYIAMWTTSWPDQDSSDTVFTQQNLKFYRFVERRL